MPRLTHLITAVLLVSVGALTQAASLHLRALHLRQVINPAEIPAQCQSTCALWVEAVNECTDDACVCTDPINRSMVGCYDCILALDPGLLTPSELQQTQSDITQFEQICNSEGFPVSYLTISVPGQTPRTTAPPPNTVPPATTTPPSNTPKPSTSQAGQNTPPSSPSVFFSSSPTPSPTISSPPDSLTGGFPLTTTPVSSFSFDNPLGSTLSHQTIGSTPLPSSFGAASGAVFSIAAPNNWLAMLLPVFFGLLL